MNNDKFVDVIEKEKRIFIYDDIQEVCVRAELEPDLRYFIKHKGRREIEIDGAEKSVNDAICAGEIIDKEYYDSF